MKSILAVALIAGFVAAEVPSHSYLPPPPNRGYSSGPAVVAARALDRGHQSGDHNGDHAANGLTRSGQPGHDHVQGSQSRFNDDQSYDQNAAVYPRRGLDDVNATVSYEADERGFKPQISYEDSESLARASPGYNTNANNVRDNTAYGIAQDGGPANGYHGNDQNGGQPIAHSNSYN